MCLAEIVRARIGDLLAKRVDTRCPRTRDREGTGERPRTPGQGRPLAPGNMRSRASRAPYNNHPTPLITA